MTVSTFQFKADEQLENNNIINKVISLIVCSTYLKIYKSFFITPTL